MGILALATDERVRDIHFTEDVMSVDLMGGRTFTMYNFINALLAGNNKMFYQYVSSR